MKRFLILMLALLMCMTCFASCESADEPDDEIELEEEDNEKDETEVKTEEEDALFNPVPASETITEGDFVITLSTENSVFSLADVADGEVEDLEYTLTIEYTGADSFVVARMPRFGCFNVYGENNSMPLGSRAMMATYTNVEIAPGFKAEESFTDDTGFEKLTAGKYIVECEVMFTTIPEYFEGDYQADEQTCYPTDAQLAAGGENYRYTIELPLEIVE